MIAFNILVALVAVLAGAVASVAGFGIGSLLTHEHEDVRPESLQAGTRRSVMKRVTPER
jgi:hypothetical protein